MLSIYVMNSFMRHKKLLVEKKLAVDMRFGCSLWWRGFLDICWAQIEYENIHVAHFEWLTTERKIYKFSEFLEENHATDCSEGNEMSCRWYFLKAKCKPFGGNLLHFIWLHNEIQKKYIVVWGREKGKKIFSYNNNFSLSLLWMNKQLHTTNAECLGWIEKLLSMKEEKNCRKE